MTISGLDKIPTGWETDKYSLTLSYKDISGQQHKDLLIRVYPGDRAAKRAIQEYYLMEKLNDLGFPVPHVICVEQGDDPFGRPFLVMQKIKGSTMMSLILQSSEEERVDLLNQFMGILVDLHQLDWREFAQALSVSDDVLPHSYIDRWLSAWERTLKHWQAARNLFPILEWLKANGSNISCERFSLIHGDYHPDNLLVQENGTIFVIDWGAVGVADFRLDLAWTLMLTTTYGYHPLREIILGLYEQLSGVEIRNIEYFEVMSILRRLFDLVISITQGADTLGMRQEAVDLMKKDVVHYKNVCTLLRERTGISIPKIEELLSSFQDIKSPLKLK